VSPEPKMGQEPPYQWVPCVVLTSDEVQALLQRLPPGSSLRTQLQGAAQAAEELARQLNQIERGEVRAA
jgi:hypothetical protein